ncbi:hypothetical protein LSUB1_G008329, partial [Lachnellula subtilissima]
MNDVMNEDAEPGSPSSLATDLDSKSGDSDIPMEWIMDSFVKSSAELSSSPAQAAPPLSITQEELQANSMKIAKQLAHELSTISEFLEDFNIRRSDQERPWDQHNFPVRFRFSEQQLKKRLIMARQDKATKQRGENSTSFRSPNKDVDNTEQSMTDSVGRGPLSDFNKVSPNVSYASPAYYSAYSSPWISNTPSSIKTSTAYYSAKTSLAVVFPTNAATTQSTSPPIRRGSAFHAEAESRGLILPPEEELNWSGKMDVVQHVEYERGEEVPLQTLGPIGMSLTAVVDKVQCRRILLARKTIICGRRLSLHGAFAEVEHLQKLRHPHIIRLVGSYLQGKKLSVLLYPVADYDLGAFFDEVLPITSEDTTSTKAPVKALWGQTDAEVLHTPKYPPTPKSGTAKPWSSADIFSLGCVFIEILTVLGGIDLDKFSESRSQDLQENSPYRDCLDRVFEWGTLLGQRINEETNK